MDFKYINDKNKTPSTNLSSAVHCDSPFKFLPNFSTPPSRFAKIFNPFESHQLIDRLHHSTFSPTVFVTPKSLPKREEKFNWTIEDISNLRPAAIDEATISQHVFEEDPNFESVVQQKIERFFSGKIIVPSPLTEAVRVPLINPMDSPDGCPGSSEKQGDQLKLYSEGYTQTILTLPPKLPKELENILKPYFTYTQDQQNAEIKIEDSSLYHDLFDYDCETKTPPRQDNSVPSTPDLSLCLSPRPVQVFPKGTDFVDRDSLPFDTSGLEFRECNLSPILRKSPGSVSASRLNFSAGMSVDASMIVPDIGKDLSQYSAELESSPPPEEEFLSDSTINWDMEYKNVSIISPQASPEVRKMDISNASTPHLRAYTSQRKRLSDSFKDDEDKENESPRLESIRQSRKIFRNDVTDAGYCTESATFLEQSELSCHVFASTPSKTKK